MTDYPPLPEPSGDLLREDSAAYWGRSECVAYTADQMRAYIAPVLDERDGLREIDKLNTDQMKHDGALIASLRAALENAIEAIKSWGAYADQYYKDKWDLQGDIDAALEALMSGTKEQT